MKRFAAIAAGWAWWTAGAVSASAANYAARVVEYVPGQGMESFWDVLDLEYYTNATVALGRPTVDTTLTRSQQPTDDPGTAPVLPVQAAWRWFEVVGIATNGRLTLEFEQPVTDDPDHPYGVDFLVFGNALQGIQSGGYWTNGDPQGVTLSGTITYETARVSVSPDGTNWFAFSGGPYADGFAPTLGRVYDTNAPAAFAGWDNRWWGAPTDPALPLDPRLAVSNFVGMTLADVARRYRGSAGGTPYDLADLPDLPADPETGRKTIRYVKIERGGKSFPEVDAVCGVAPVSAFKRWQIAHFNWMEDPDLEQPDADPDGDGLPNRMEYALGRNPRVADADPPPLRWSPPAAPGGAPRAVFPRNEDATDMVVALEWTTNLADRASWSTQGVSSVRGGALTNNVFEWVAELPTEAGAAFYRLRVSDE